MSEQEKSRNYFRLEYPKEARPVIKLGKYDYSVINLCERGVKLVFHPAKARDHLAIADTVTATITFHDANSTQVVGRVLRFDKDALVLELSEGIPLQRIMVEQRYLLGKYGNLKLPYTM